jgi:hypothetical protein
MKIFSKTRLPNGFRNIYFCGIRIFSYFNTHCIPDFKSDIYKFVGLQRCKNLENLVVGSSHGRDAFIPRARDYNLANSSQDLYRMYKLYEYVVKHKGQNLKNVIVFWSVFHSGFQLEKTKECLHCVPYKILYGIDYACEMYPVDRRIVKNIENLMATTNVPNNYRGKSFYISGHSDKTEKIATGHLKNTIRNNNQIQYLAQIVELARQKGHNVYVVLPPYRKDYTDCLPDDKIVFAELFKFLKHNQDVRLINLGHDTDFKDSDFANCDHCNERGGRKVTTKINKIIMG